MRRKQLWIVAVAVLSATVAGTISRAATATRSCPDYYVIDSRGSGGHAEQASPPGAAFIDALRQDLPGTWIQTKDNPYPAVSVFSIKAIQDVLNGFGALARIKQIGAYHASIAQGEADLKELIRAKEGSACGSTTKIVLVGYSQGAQVTGNVYQSLGFAERTRIFGVVLFGDPRYNHASWADMYNRDNNGILPVRGEFPADGPGKVLSFCHAQDLVCQGIGQAVHGKTPHETYGVLGEPQKAAQLIAADMTGQTATGPGSSTIAGATELPLQTVVIGGENSDPVSGHEYWLVKLSAADRLTINYRTLNQYQVSLIIYSPDTSDSSAPTARPTAIGNTGSSGHATFHWTAPASGQWVVALWGAFGLSYQLTAYVENP